VLTSIGISVAPVSLDFGNVVLGTTGEIAVTFTNMTAGPLMPNYSGGAPLDANNFGGSQNCAGVALAAGASCQFTYTFSPTLLGPHDSSTTVGVDSDNVSITMKGCGIVTGGSC
jgi:hypothetical protein